MHQPTPGVDYVSRQLGDALRQLNRLQILSRKFFRCAASDSNGATPDRDTLEQVRSVRVQCFVKLVALSARQTRSRPSPRLSQLSISWIALPCAGL